MRGDRFRPRAQPSRHERFGDIGGVRIRLCEAGAGRVHPPTCERPSPIRRAPAWNNRRWSESSSSSALLRNASRADPLTLRSRSERRCSDRSARGEERVDRHDPRGTCFPDDAQLSVGAGGAAPFVPLPQTTAAWGAFANPESKRLTTSADAGFGRSWWPASDQDARSPGSRAKKGRCRRQSEIPRRSWR